MYYLIARMLETGLTITMIGETDSITIIASPITDHPKLFEVIVLDDEENNISLSYN